jgi:shikimate dehydrogenase
MDAHARAPMPNARYAVVGHPVEHSQSPFIHRRFADLTGEAVDYTRLPCEPGRFAQTLRQFAEEGASGCNVTVPFKFEVPGLCARVSERAALAGAANTVRFDADGWHCDNTDGVGLVRDIAGQAARPIAGCRVLLIGAGGAAAGVLGPLLDERPAEIVVANRTLHRAADLVQRHAAVAARAGSSLLAGTLADCAEDGPQRGFDIVVNASSSSLAEADVPVAATVLAPGALAIDLMYGPAAAPFVHWAQQAGAQGRDGLGMLVEQAAEAFWFFRGVRPPSKPVLEALRSRLASAA